MLFGQLCVIVFIADPFSRIAFLGQSQVTEKLDKTLCPTWDQTLIFEQIEIHGDPKQIAQKPPEIVLEIFDHDTFVSTTGIDVVPLQFLVWW